MHLHKLMWLPALALLLLTACSKDDDTGSGSGSNVVIPRSKVDAKVNGSVFYPTDVQADLNGELLTIVGSRNLGTGKESVIVLQLKHYKGPNTYLIDTATQASYTDLGVSANADSGAVVITAIDDVHYTGSFGFRATGPGGTYRISAGAIDVYK